MSVSQFFYRSAVAIALAASLLSPLPSHADEVQIFPPMLPDNTTICPPVPAGANYSYTLVWDGQHNVQCAQVPTSCPKAGQGLQYDPASGSFICVTACSGPSYGFQTTGVCPSGQSGEIGIPVEVTCDGVAHYSAPVNNCQPTVIISTTNTTPCPIGSQVYGSLSGGVLDSLVCTTNPSACRSYTCTAAGLQ